MSYYFNHAAERITKFSPETRRLHLPGIEPNLSGSLIAYFKDLIRQSTSTTEACHLGYFRKHNYSATFSFTFQFGEEALWKCNGISIEYQPSLRTLATYTSMTTKGLFIVVFPQLHRSLQQ
jgi:hypothetical protein